MSNLEVEVKFFVTDLADFRERVLAAGGVIKKARVYERNVRFDTPDEALRHRLELLRLRQDTAVKVTFKGPAAEQATSEAKVREEFEIEVSDFDKTAVIFERLGFAPMQVYEKYRETLQLDDVEVVLDEMPFGNFVELEGTEAGIKTAVSTLSLDWSQRILTNYLSLMAQMKAKHNLPFDDLTFANFEGMGLSVDSVLSE
ncbi:MAG: class IV adenylate cyclase [Chloroflexota bacterium]